MEDPGAEVDWISRNPTRTLGALTADLLINIFCFLRPNDIVNVGKTCKDLHSATMYRTVWLDALRRVVAEHHLFTPTFPLQQMSYQQLKHAALSPYLFVHHARHLEESEPMAPSFVRTLINCLTKKDRKTLSALLDVPQSSLYRYDDNYHFREIMVAPGGRFLFTVSEHMSTNVIKLWDLGYPGCHSIHSSSVALMIQPSDYAIHGISPTADGLGLHLTTSTYFSPALTRIFVHEIYPLDSSPSFYERSTLEVSGRAQRLTVSGQRLACIYGSANIVVWDITNDLTVHWVLDTQFLTQIRGLHICGDTLIICLDFSFSVWTIPPLSQRIAHCCVDQSVLPAAPILDIVILSDPGSILEQLPFANVDYLIHLSITPGAPIPSGYRTVVYKIDLSRSLTSPMPCKNLPFILTGGNIAIDLDASHFSFLASAKYEICDGNIIVLPSQGILDESEYPLFLIPIPDKAEGWSLSTFCRKLLIGRMSTPLRSVEICPATGRFCILTMDNEIRVIDYLSGVPV